MAHPATGPISPDELRRIADLPFGHAADELRKHDPLFGKGEDAKAKWSVALSSYGKMSARTIIEADSEKEARAIIKDRSADDFDWEPETIDDVEVEWIEVEK